MRGIQAYSIQGKERACDVPMAIPPLPAPRKSFTYVPFPPVIKICPSTCPSVHPSACRHALTEVLSLPSVMSRIADTKAAREVRLRVVGLHTMQL